MSEYQCDNCLKAITPSEKICPACGYPQQGSKPEKIRYNTKLMRIKDLVEDSEKSIKSIFSFAIIFIFMAIVVLAFSVIFKESQYQFAFIYLLCTGIYFVLNRVGKRSSYLMSILALFFYLGHTIFEFSNGMFLKSPVELDKSFTETRGATLFFALIPMAYMLFRFALMIVLAKYLWTELKLKKDEKMTDFIRNNKLNTLS